MLLATAAFFGVGIYASAILLPDTGQLLPLPVVVIIGGMGRLYSLVVSATIFAYLEEVILTKFPYYYLLIFGVILVVAILYLPDGLVGFVQRMWRRWRKGGSVEQNAST